MQNADAVSFGCHFFYQLQSFAAQFSAQRAKARYVSAGMGQVIDETVPDRIDGTDHDDGNCFDQSLCRPYLNRHDDNIHLELDKFADESLKDLELGRSVAILDEDILAFYITKVA